MKPEPGNLIFTGFTSCGKSSTGKLVADRLKYRFIDLDEVVEALHVEHIQQDHQSQTCREIYASHGEEYFKSLELQALLPLRDQKGIVISPGGGILQEENSRLLLREIGTIFYLATTAETIFKRMKTKGFPQYLGANPSLETIREHLERRRSTYETWCDYRIDTDTLSPEQTADAVVELCTTHFIIGET